MLSSFLKLGDDLMKVPKLDVGGANWVIYKDQFLWSVVTDGFYSALFPPIYSTLCDPLGSSFYLSLICLTSPSVMPILLPLLYLHKQTPFTTTPVLSLDPL